MLAEAKSPELYAEWLDSIGTTEVKSAFVHIVGLSACSETFVCHPQLKGKDGPIRDFRFLHKAGENWFSFITNKAAPLRFYFRAPATRSGHYTFEALAAVIAMRV